MPILSARKSAYENLSKQTKKMKVMSEATHPILKVGDNVLIPIPNVDRAKADFRYVIGVVLQQADDLYKLGTKDGILDKLYCRYVTYFHVILFIHMYYVSLDK